MAKRERAVNVDESGPKDTPVIVSLSTGKNTNYLAMNREEATKVMEGLVTLLRPSIAEGAPTGR